MFSITESGTYTIKLGTYAEAEISVSPASAVGTEPSVIGGVSVFLDSDSNICIAGRISNFADNENASVIVVPSGKPVTPDNILYIDQVEIESDGSFIGKTEIYSTEKQLDIYIGATNAARTASGLEYDGIYKVKSFDYNNDYALSVSAILYNTTETDKNANIFIAQYDETGKIVDIASSEVIVRHSEAEPQKIGRAHV